MPRRKLPSPEEYGRRLADARRRAEKREHEKTRQTVDGFSRVLRQLDEQRQALAEVSRVLDTLPTEALNPAETIAAFEKLQDHLKAIQLAVENIHIETPPAAVPESLHAALQDMLRKLDESASTSPPPRVDPVVPLDPPQTIFDGPITLKVTGRDDAGDIDTVQVEPTRH